MGWDAVIAGVALGGTATYVAARNHPRLFPSIFMWWGVLSIGAAAFLLGWDARGMFPDAKQIMSLPRTGLLFLCSAWMCFLALNLREISKRAKDSSEDRTA